MLKPKNLTKLSCICLIGIQTYLCAKSSNEVNKLAIDLYKKLSNSKNLIFSPLSVSTCLAMLYGGAKGNSELEIGKVCNFSSPQDSFHFSYVKNYNTLVSKYREKSCFLSVSNSIWAHDQYVIEKPFTTLITKTYNSELFTVNFGQSEIVRQRINSWILKKTDNKISDLLKINSVSNDTRFILISTVYFNARWQDAFKRKDTKNERFYIRSDSNIIVKMMSRMGTYNFYQDSLLKAIKLNYANSSLGLVAFLPNINNLINLENRISEEMINSVCNSMRSKEVVVNFPKFKFFTDTSLKDILFRLGIQDAFGSKADFSGISANKDLFLTEVFHSAFIEVDEKRTEATAATAALFGFGGGSKLDMFEYFTADHPFIFIIKDFSSNTIVFMGKVENPLMEK